MNGSTSNVTCAGKEWRAEEGVGRSSVKGFRC